MNEPSSDKPQDRRFCPFCVAGQALSAPYAAVMHLRRRAYRMGLKKSYPAAAAVICVGNITTGGTGKTPIVAWVTARLRQMGKKPAILTRGYKARDGRSDEAELLRRLTGVEVFVQADRLAGARKAVRAGADVLVMDDGFQHLRLRRDLDIVLIDALTRPFGGGYCLPAGRLREPLGALADADAVVITRANQVSAERLGEIRDRVVKFAPRASLHAAVHKPVGVIDETGRPLDTSALGGKRIFAFCGLGNPRAFFQTVRSLGADPVGQQALADHVEYTRRLTEQLRSQANRANAEIMLTTQKDFTKLTKADLARPVWQLAVEIEIIDGRDKLLEKIRQASSG